MAASLMQKACSSLHSLSSFHGVVNSCYRNISILKNYRVPSVLVCASSFHTTVPAHEGKYHNLKKKTRIRKQRHAMLRSRFERLEEEERPTGCVLCPKRGDIDINYKLMSDYIPDMRRLSPLLCVKNNVRLLSQFVSPHTGRIYSRTITGLCLIKQKQIAKAIRRSQSMGFMPVTMKYFEFHNDPKLY